MLQRMLADFCFCNPHDAGPATAVLVEHGFDVENLDDRIDECGPTVFIRARLTTDLTRTTFSIGCKASSNLSAAIS